MLKIERNAVLALAMILSCRMLGIFMILPIFSAATLHRPGSTPILIGIALGIYGLTQACFQIPFGCWSDRIGRKRVILYGLLLFALGSLVAAFSTSMTGLIIGRALQGAGAIGSTVLALVADLTPERECTKAMAMVGMIIGLSFSFALIAGPIICYWFDLSGIFLFTAGLAVFAIVILYTLVPTPAPCIKPPMTGIETRHRFLSVLIQPQLLYLNAGIFILHAILTSTFVGVPILLTHLAVTITPTEHIMLYLGVLGFSFLLMLPLMIIAEKKKKHRALFIVTITGIIVSEIVLATATPTLLTIGLTLLLFFTAFTFLEATLPSLVSRTAPIERKGAAMGIYSTAQFSGIFVGGSLGGVIFSHFHLVGLFVFCSIMATVWLLLHIYGSFSYKTRIAKNNG